MTTDPYAPYLRQADELFAQGEIVKAGQIWQAILKKQPAHAESRERLLLVKQRLLAQREAAAAAPQPAPEPPPPAPSEARDTAPERPAEPRDTAPEASLEPPRPGAPDVDPDRLLAEGCTLYDMGQIGDALRKWEQVLAQVPTHALARGYANGARRELGLPVQDALPAPVRAPEAAVLGDEDTDKLLREAVQLYDMGLTEEAISKWERVLQLEPHRTEIQGYLTQARRELGATPAPPPAPPAPAAARPEPPAEVDPAAAFSATAGAPAPAESVDLKLRQGEHLLTLQRHEEAAFTFQQALALDPGNARALAGLMRCRKPAAGASARPEPAPQARVQSAASQTGIQLDDPGLSTEASEPAAPLDTPAAQPPATVQRSLPAPRTGLALPQGFQSAAERLPWLKDPKVLALAGGTALVIVLASWAVHSYRKDQTLKEDVQAARAAAVAPLAQQAQAPDLTETAAALREEADAALGVDPLRAYYRAETLVLRHPDQPGGAQLLEKARAALAGGATGASLPEFQKHLQNGDLEAAAKVMDALLRAQPGDEDLKARAARVHLALCSAHAAQGKWEAAQDDLLRGRALFPGDKGWQARLKLLERVKGMSRAEQAAWISLLG